MLKSNGTLLFNLALSCCCIIFSGCLSSGPASETLATTAVDNSAVQNTPEFQRAATFDKFCKNELPIEQREELKRNCKKHGAVTENPFCYSVIRSAAVEKKVKESTRLAHPSLEGKPEPIVPALSPNGKIKNWTKLRRARVSALLAGLADANVERLQQLGAAAQKAKGCPNNLAIATAAMLESSLPDSPVMDQISALYEIGGNCARKHSYDREHFYTRAALFQVLQKKFDRAEKLLTKVHPTDAFSGRAVYWLYRTRLAQGKNEEAQATLAKLRKTHPFSFHSLLTQAADNQDPMGAFPANVDVTQKRSQRNPKVNAVLEQVEILKHFGFEWSAAVLVDWVLDDFRPIEAEVRIYLAALGDSKTKILTLADILLRKPNLRVKQTLELAYPKAYFQILEKYKGQVDPYLMLAVARKESTLNPNAISPANAQGLLQLNPDTAKKLGSKPDANLLDPEINAQFAAKYLADLFKLMRGQLPLVIASYNAGEEPVMRWVRRYPTTDLLLFIDLIPYRETRDYVGFVMSNYFWYHRLYLADTDNVLRKLVTTELAKVDAPDAERVVKSIPETAPSMQLPDNPMEVEKDMGPATNEEVTDGLAQEPSQSEMPK